MAGGVKKAGSLEVTGLEPNSLQPSTRQELCFSVSNEEGLCEGLYAGSMHMYCTATCA